MSTIGTKTGIGEYSNLKEKVRKGLSLCKTNCALNCGNCPYVFLKDEKNGDISSCTSALMEDAEEFINSLLGNCIEVYGAIYSH